MNEISSVERVGKALKEGRTIYTETVLNKKFRERKYHFLRV